MKSKAKIPFLQEFSELHAAFGLPYKSDFTDINLFRYEDAKSCPDHIAPYRTSFYQVFLIMNSELIGKYNDNHIHFEPDKSYLFFTCPGKLISWRKTGDLHGYIFSFKPSFLFPFMPVASFLKKFSYFRPEKNEPFVLRSKKDVQLILGYFARVSEEYDRSHKGRYEIICHYIFILFETINRLFADNPESGTVSAKISRQSSLLKDFESLVRKNLTRRKTISDCAKLLHVTPKYLSAVLKTESGKTARQIVQEILMLEARSLLLQTDRSIAEISDLLGFSDPSHFARMFKSRVGKTPLTFRKN